MKTRPIIATILLIMLISWGAFSIYWRITEPMAYVCAHNTPATGETFIAYNNGDIFKPDIIAPSCQDGTYMQNMPYIGWTYRYGNHIGLFMAIIGILIWWKYENKHRMEKDRS